MTLVSPVTVGFSILSALVLFFAHAVFLKNVNKPWLALGPCAALLVALSA